MRFACARSGEYLSMYVYNPQLKPHKRARVASGEPPIACMHVEPPYTSAGSAPARSEDGLQSEKRYRSHLTPHPHGAGS